MKILRCLSWLCLILSVACSGRIFHQSSPPQSPQAFSISSVASYDSQVALTWTPSAYATSYSVMYGTSSGVYDVTYATDVTDTFLVVENLNNDIVYYFMVVAINAYGSTRALAEVSSVPAPFALSNDFSVLTLAWATDWSSSINLTRGNLPGYNCNSNVVATSSNSGVIGNSNLILSGTYPNCMLTYGVGAGITGSTSINLTSATNPNFHSQVLTLDILPQAAAVYSVRQLVLAYTGAAMNVRQDTYNAQADVNFDNTGIISGNSSVLITNVGTSPWSLNQTMPFSSFFADANVYVYTWYDQSGQVNHAVQATPQNQPQIVNNATLNIQNSKPAINFIAASKTFLTLLSYPFAKSTSCHVGLVFANQNSGYWARYFDFGANEVVYIFATVKDTYKTESRFRISLSSISGEQGPIGLNISKDPNDNIFSFSHTGNSMAMWENSIQLAATASNVTILPSQINAPNCYLGRSQFIAAPYFDAYINGNYQEFLAFAAALSTQDRQALEAEQEAYYAVSLTE